MVPFAGSPRADESHLEWKNQKGGRPGGAGTCLRSGTRMLWSGGNVFYLNRGVSYVDIHMPLSKFTKLWISL